MKFEFNNIAYLKLFGRKSSLGLLFSLFVLLSCSETQPDNKGVVATVGSFEISDQHFTNQLKRLYLRTGQAANVNEDFRLGVINARIERYSIVEFARDKGWANDADGIYNKSMIERKVMMEAYEKHFIHDRVQITDNHLREVFRRHNTTLRASHLLARNRAEADSLYNLVNAGASFENLAKNVFENPRLANSGGDVGYFTLDEMDIAFEEAAYSMNIGEISAPVKTSTGFSIIKVTDIVGNPMITEAQFAQRRNSVAQVARSQQNELATRRDMQQVLSGMTWDLDLVETLWQITQDQSDNYRTRRPELAELPLEIDETLRNRVISSKSGFRFTVQDYLSEAYFTPPQRRDSANDYYAFEEQIRGLAYRSYALGLINNYAGLDKEYIQGTIDETFYGYLFQRFEGYMDTQVEIEDSQVRQAYDSNMSLFEQELELDVSEIVLTDGELAGEVYEALKRGARFDDQLRRFGAPSESKERGGKIGFVPITRFGTMAPQLRNLQPGEVAGPFQVANNYYIVLKCMGRKDPRPLSFEEAEPLVREYVFTNERQRVRDSLVLDLRTRYNASIDMQRLNSLSFEL
ncbi:MAG: peptidylprolyl isomerase [Balneolales bacterium]|nr:peptidylprolyl isomerase [Balneolales bacterium]